MTAIQGNKCYTLWRGLTSVLFCCQLQCDIYVEDYVEDSRSVSAQVYGGMMYMDFSSPGANRWLLIS